MSLRDEGSAKMEELYEVEKNVRHGHGGRVTDKPEITRSVIVSQEERQCNLP